MNIFFTVLLFCLLIQLLFKAQTMLQETYGQEHLFNTVTTAANTMKEALQLDVLSVINHHLKVNLVLCKTPRNRVQISVEI